MMHRRSAGRHRAGSTIWPGPPGPPGPPAPPRPHGPPRPKTKKPRAGGTGILKGAFLYTFVGLVQKASGFILLPVVARVMTPAEYGRVSVLVAINTFLVALMAFGLENPVVRAHYRLRGDELARYLLAARRISHRWAVAAGGALAAAALPLGFRGLAGGTLALEILGSALAAAGTTYSYAVLRANRSAANYAVLGCGILLTQTLARVAFVVVPRWGAFGWALSDLVAGLVALVLGVLVCPAPGPVPRRRGRRRVRAAVVRESLPLVPHYLSIWVMGLSDRLVLSATTSLDALGRYAVAVQLTSFGALLIAEANRALMPEYGSARAGSEALARVVRGQVGLSFGVAAVNVPLAVIALRVAFPASYDGGRWVFALAVGNLLYGLYLIPMSGVTVVAGRTTLAPLITGAAAGLNLAGNLLLDRRFGVGGAVASTIVAYCALLAGATAAELRMRNLLVWPRTALSASAALGAVLTFLTGLLPPVGSPSGYLVAAGAALGGLVFLVHSGRALASGRRPGARSRSEPQPQPQSQPQPRPRADHPDAVSA